MTNGSCGVDNGGCKDICLSTPNGPRCACWIGKDFAFGSKCSVPSEFTFTTCHSEIILVLLCVLYLILFRVVRDTVCIFPFYLFHVIVSPSTLYIHMYVCAYVRAYLLE